RAHPGAGHRADARGWIPGGGTHDPRSPDPVRGRHGGGPRGGRLADSRVRVIDASATAVEQPTFFYDLGDPYSYLVAEQISSTLPVVPEWEPVLGSAFDSGMPTLDREEIERLATAL